MDITINYSLFCNLLIYNDSCVHSEICCNNVRMKIQYPPDKWKIFRIVQLYMKE